MSAAISAQKMSLDEYWCLDGITRAANTASPVQLVKCMRSNLSCLDAQLYGQSSYDAICSSYEELIVDLLQATARPTPKHR